MDFLKADLSDGIEAVLEKTLFGVQTDLEDIAAETFAQLMGIREKIVERTKELRRSGGNLRQQEILGVFSEEMMRIILEVVSQEINSFDKLSEVTESLLTLKERISNEIVRSLISVSPVPTAAPATRADCELEEQQHTDLVISKLEQLALETERTNVLLGLIDLQAVMDERLNQLFQADCCSTLIGQDPSRYWALIGCQTYNAMKIQKKAPLPSAVSLLHKRSSATPGSLDPFCPAIQV